ncbi:hypothetical protein OPV22_014182 [Ensete ventricosum]|uniref:Uncharacterized protein n=1 Tax=Ensete ventricosum TaxID=4639 RepID=A0AAV8R6J9_ENSVE|nr:hypothetical protein OPV22_014182 [Ensete ventricosum]
MAGKKKGSNVVSDEEIVAFICWGCGNDQTQRRETLKVAAARDGLGYGGCEIRRRQRRLQRRQRQWLKAAVVVAEERSLGNEKQVLTMGCDRRLETVVPGRRLEREQGKEEEEDEGNDWGSRGQGTMTADVGQCWSGVGRRC